MTSHIYKKMTKKGDIKKFPVHTSIITPVEILSNFFQAKFIIKPPGLKFGLNRISLYSEGAITTLHLMQGCHRGHRIPSSAHCMKIQIREKTDFFTNLIQEMYDNYNTGVRRPLSHHKFNRDVIKV